MACKYGYFDLVKYIFDDAKLSSENKILTLEIVDGAE